MKYTRVITLLAASTMLATFSAHAYDKDGDGKQSHHKNHHQAPLHRYTLTGGATYLAPSINGLDYLTTQTVTPNTYDPNHLNPNYSWGYFLAFGYMISSHYDIQASWQQYNSNQSEEKDFSPATAGFIHSASDFVSAVAAGATAEATSEEVLDTQAFDATFGQYHKLSSMLTARPFVGVKYAQVNDKTSNTYTTPSIVNGPNNEIYDSKFSGAGPEIGLDAEFKIVQHFGMTGHVAVAALVGDLQTSTHIYNAVVDLANVEDEKNNRVIPSLDAKIGLNWNSLYSHDRFGIGIDGGYQVAYFFDVVDQVTANDGGIAHNFSDVGIMGPYLNLSARF
jgi:hypothetical protein